MTTISSQNTNLEITNIKIYKLNIPLKEVFQISTTSINNAENVLIQVNTNEGIIGWGEAASFHSIVGETQLINFSAATQFAMSSKIMQLFDLDSHFEHAYDLIIDGVTCENGILKLPDDLGIGAYPDLDFVKALEEIN